MKLLSFDTETTGLDPQKDHVTEVGLVLFDVETKQPVRLSGYLVKAPGGVSSEITKLTGITNEMLATYGIEPRPALQAILNMAKNADILVAHNAPFDRGFLEAWCKREGLEFPSQPWVDSRTDMPKEAYQLGKSVSLRYWAADHGFLYDAHRAVNDALAVLKIMSMYDIEATVARSRIPNVRVRAVVSFDERQQAKEAGFFWSPEQKIWWRPIKLDEIDDLKIKCKFSVVQMTEAQCPTQA